MRIIIFAVLLAACGDDVAGRRDQVLEGELRVTALLYGAPRGGTRILLHDADGAVSRELTPDADGSAAATVSSPTSVTVAFAPENGDRVQTFTVFDALPGEHVVVDLRLERPATTGNVTVSYTPPAGTNGLLLDIGCADDIVPATPDVPGAASLDVIEACPEAGASINVMVTALAPFAEPVAWALVGDQVVAPDLAVSVDAWSTQFTEVPIVVTEPATSVAVATFLAEVALDGVWHLTDEESFGSGVGARSEVLFVPQLEGELVHLQADATLGTVDQLTVSDPIVAAHWLTDAPTAPPPFAFDALGVPLVRNVARDTNDPEGRTITWSEEGDATVTVDGVVGLFDRFDGTVRYMWMFLAPPGRTSVRLPALPDDLAARLPAGDHSLTVTLIAAPLAEADHLRAHAGGWARTAFNGAPPADAAFTSVVSEGRFDE